MMAIRITSAGNDRNDHMNSVGQSVALWYDALFTADPNQQMMYPVY